MRSTVPNVRKGTGTGVFVTTGAVTVFALTFPLALVVVVVVPIVPYYGAVVDEVVAVVCVALVDEIPFAVE